jgi:phage replication O-like protein O
MATDNQTTFQGFQFPTTTPVPDEVFDVLMPQLSGAELKVLLYICRRTFGFKKKSDTISLHQIAHGITTRDGRVLDSGTGLCKRHVQRALKVLEKKNIIKVTRKVDETGLYEVNTYSLNIVDTGSVAGTKCPYGRDKMSPGVETAGSGGVGTPASTTTNSNQETVLQETDTVVDVVTQDLENFGIAKSAVTRLTQRYPAAYIREKLEMAKGLVAAGSCLVSQNPAGWLRKAIEEDYSPLRTYQRSSHKARTARDRKTAQVELREQQMPKEKHQQAQTISTESERTVATETGQCQQNVATQYTDKQTGSIATEKAHRENETTWNKILEKLQADLPLGEAGTPLKGTTLLELTDTAARILVPNPNALVWLERRMYGQISKAMKGVVGKELDLQFIAAS